MRIVSLPAVVALVVLAAAVGACGGVAGKTLDQGEQYAEAVQWDDASRSYQEDLELDPEYEDGIL
ncbi:MAG: hypothetical protein KJO07_13435, partial [Deltaproteobacteria bacterium]|nr:hypothetical protein [Deltaproteobacteria bacterium]